MRSDQPASHKYGGMPSGGWIASIIRPAAMALKPMIMGTRWPVRRSIMAETAATQMVPIARAVRSVPALTIRML